MIYPKVDVLLEHVDSKYALVIAAAKRARQINDYHHQLGEGSFEGFAPPLIESRSKNFLTMALEEIAEGKLEVSTSDANGLTTRGRAAWVPRRRPPYTSGMILLGVSGGVAAYKSCELVRLLVSAGHDVQVMLTPAAERFVGETTFAALSRRPVLTERSAEVFPHLEASRGGPAVLHRARRRQHDRGARPRRGADRAGPVGAGVHRAAAGRPGHEPAHVVGGGHRQATSQTLRDRGVELIGPERGEMAEGEHGLGRMTEPAEIAERIERRLDAGRRLEGRRVLVTAGGTREPLDAVRFLGNRSSGRWASRSPTRRPAAAPGDADPGRRRRRSPSAPMRTLRAESAEQLHAATLAEAATADVIVMAAAVADYRPAAAGRRQARQGRGALDDRAGADRRHPGRAGRSAARRPGADRLRRRVRRGRRRARPRQAGAQAAPT